MDILKRSLAPIPAEAWGIIDEEAVAVLKNRLTARKAVDFSGPLGLQYAAVNTGRNMPMQGKLVDQVHVYTRKLLPLLEVRTGFVLQSDEIQALARGAEDVDLEPLTGAARRMARAEDQVVFSGYPDMEIDGMIAASAHQPITIGEGPGKLMPLFIQAMGVLLEASVNGPYMLLVNPELYAYIHASHEGGYPLKNRLKDMLGGDMLISPSLEAKGLLLSQRGGDFQLVVGQDMSVGYSHQDEEGLHFFMMESFTFKVNTPEAVVVLK